MKRILPKWYGDFTTFILLFGLVIVLPIVLIFTPGKDAEILVNKKYYCYINSCDGVSQIFALKYSEKYEEYISFFEENGNCMIFNLPKENPGLIKNHMLRLNPDSLYYVKSIIMDSTVARIKIRNINKAKGSSSGDFFHVWVPIYTLHEAPPPQLAQVCDLCQGMKSRAFNPDYVR